MALRACKTHTDIDRETGTETDRHTDRQRTRRNIGRHKQRHRRRHTKTDILAGRDRPRCTEIH